MRRTPLGICTDDITRQAANPGRNGYSKATAPFAHPAIRPSMPNGYTLGEPGDFTAKYDVPTYQKQLDRHALPSRPPFAPPGVPTYRPVPGMKPGSKVILSSSGLRPHQFSRASTALRGLGFSSDEHDAVPDGPLTGQARTDASAVMDQVLVDLKKRMVTAMISRSILPSSVANNLLAFAAGPIASIFGVPPQFPNDGAKQIYETVKVASNQVDRLERGRASVLASEHIDNGNGGFSVYDLPRWLALAQRVSLDLGSAFSESWSADYISLIPTSVAAAARATVVELKQKGKEITEAAAASLWEELNPFGDDPNWLLIVGAGIGVLGLLAYAVNTASTAKRLVTGVGGMGCVACGTDNCHCKAGLGCTCETYLEGAPARRHKSRKPRKSSKRRSTRRTR